MLTEFNKIGIKIKKILQKVQLKKPILSLVETNPNALKNLANKKSITVLQNLVIEEATLKEEKKKLESFNKTLEIKVKEEIETKKNHIQQLKSEINDLKFFRQELAKSPRAVVNMKYYTPNVNKKPINQKRKIKNFKKH